LQYSTQFEFAFKLLVKTLCCTYLYWLRNVTEFCRPAQDNVVASQLELQICINCHYSSTLTIVVYYYSAQKLILILPFRRG